MAPRLLIVDDEPNILAALRRALELEGYTVEVAGSGRLAMERLKGTPFDAVLLDVAMPEMDGLQTLRAIKAAQPELPVMMMSGHATLATAVEATRLGACDFLEKPLTTDKVLITVANALKLARFEEQAQAERARSRAEIDDWMIGGGARMKRIVDTIKKAAPTTARVLITGERGSGKELVARAVHELSRRANGPFVKLNCAAIPSELIESELFGHEKGAFTGATRERRGKFEQAHGGTLFLDEIGDMASGAQAKVLRALQENEIERVGGSETISVDVRVVAATNKDLSSEIGRGGFRADLYDRLNVVPVQVPPLRDRKEDIPALVRHFVGQLASASARPTVSDAALAMLMQHDWPGNVRELRNIVERLLIFSSAGAIGEPEVAEALPHVRARVGERRFQRGVALKDLVAAAERDLVLAALEANDWHMAATARELHLERSHLYKKMRALGIRPRGADDGEEVPDEE
jgi:DNA-binding NtrC family response regulator